MSFLNSVISSIDANSVPIEVPEVRRVKIPASSNVKSQALPSPASTSGLKRKAEFVESSEKEKVPRTGTPQEIRSDSRTANAITRPQLVKSNTAPTQGSKNITKESPKQPQPVLPNKPGVDVPKAAPKKGSFAEIMARAKMNQTSQVGVITHRPTMSAKKEIALQKGLASQKNRQNGRPFKLGDKAQHPSLVKQSSARSPEKPAKSSARLVTEKPNAKVPYQGTSKPKAQPAYKGTMKHSSSAGKKAFDKEPSRKSQLQYDKQRRNYNSEYSDDSGVEDDDDGRYRWNSEENSDDYSDMDAGFDEVEDEDEMAGRMAKKEDELEQKRLDDLKRQKEEKKKQLTQLAAREKQRR